MESIDKFIKQIFPNEEVRECNLKIIASGMCGKGLDKFIIWNGCGGNGKGVLNKLIQACYGNYYKKASNSILSEKNTNSGSANPEKASLDKKRYVVFVEPDKDTPFNCGTLKELTGEKEISARHLYNTKKTTISVHGTLVVECNQKPKLLEFDEAMERRIMDILFESRFTDIEEDISPEDNVFKMDRSIDSEEWRGKHSLALFHYLQPYFLKLYNDEFNLKVPQCIIERNLKYLSDSNNLYSWFKSTMDEDYEGYSYIQKVDNPQPEDFIKLKDIYEMFTSGIYYQNLTKKEKRDLNKSKFMDELLNIRQIRNYYKARYRRIIDGKERETRNVLVGFKIVRKSSGFDMDDEL